MTSVACQGVVVSAFFRGEKNITNTDKVSFVGALLAWGLWWLTSNPFWAVILVTLTDALAFVPTFRKSYCQPWQETAATYGLDTLKFIIGLFALESYNLTTWFYPAALILMDGSFVIYLIIRRRQADGRKAA